MILNSLQTKNETLSSYLINFFGSKIQKSFQLLETIDKEVISRQIESHVSDESTLEEIALLLAVNKTNEQKRKINIQIGKTVSNFFNPVTVEENNYLAELGESTEDETTIDAVLAVKLSEEKINSVGFKLNGNTTQRDLLPSSLKRNPDLYNNSEIDLLSKYLIFDSLIKKVGIKQSQTIEQQESLLRVFQEAQNANFPVTVIAPVCPDYSNVDYSLRFGISSTARVTIDAINNLIPIAKQSGLNFVFHILVADTEDDMPTVLQRLTKGDITEFKRRTKQSVNEIRDEVNNSGNAHIVNVSTFSDSLGDQFRNTQYAIESNLRSSMEVNESLRNTVIRTSNQRAEKYKLILGHYENNQNLTIRYAAQYASLAYLTKQFDQPVALMNYSTPNLAYFAGDEYQLITGDNSREIPILEVVF